MAISKETALNSLQIFKEFQDATNAEKFVAKEQGKMLTSNDFTDALKNKLDGLSNYTLPTASSTVKGGVKVGDGLAMDGDTLKVTLATSEEYTLPTASSSTKGGVKVGTGLSMNGDTLNVTLDSGDKYSVFGGATASTDGTSGLVPKPVAGENDKFLRGDGTWAEANITVIQNSSGSNVVIDKKIPAIQGALWQDIINGDPCLKLRYNDYEYNYYYDFINTNTIITPTLETDKAQMYTLGTTPSTVDGGLWYTVEGLDSSGINGGYPVPWVKVGNFDYGFKYDTITYKGGNADLISYMPFEASTVDALGNNWTESGSQIVEVNPVVDNEMAFGGRAALNVGQLSTSVATNPSSNTNWTVDFWLSVPNIDSYSTDSTLYTFIQFYCSANTWVPFGILGGKLTRAKIDKSASRQEAEFDFIGKRTHLAFTGSNKIYINGECIRSSSVYQYTGTNNGNNYNYNTGAQTLRKICLFPNWEDIPVKIYIDHFRIHNKIVWNDTFTPPVASEYYS